jgi:hypothetical protein
MLRKVNDNIVREALETRTATGRDKGKGANPSTVGELLHQE